MSFLDDPISLIPISPKRTMGGISGYLTIDENTTDKLTVTKHPVQQGVAISDHAYKEPSELNVKIQMGLNIKPLSELYQDFLKLQSDRTKFEVTTPKRTYKNMVLVSISQTTDKITENALALNLSLLEIITVEVTPTVVPERGKQANAGITGATEKGGKKSALKITDNATGGIVSRFLGLGG